ncbi:MAG: cyclase family protein [Actinomycetes bacterium]
MLHEATVVDLSAPLSELTVLWPGETPIQATVLDSHDVSGSYSRRVSLPEHIGTHLDAPCHYAPGGATVSEIPVGRLVRPLVVIDISTAIGDDADAVLTTAMVEDHERRFGRVSRGCAVFLRTGWDGRRGDAAAYRGCLTDDERDLHFPGFGVTAAELLVEARGVVGLGIDTLGIDAGHDLAAPVHRGVSLPRGVWHVENLVNLGEVPPTGAWVVVGVPRVVDGSGFPARVIALVP